MTGQYQELADGLYGNTMPGITKPATTDADKAHDAALKKADLYDNSTMRTSQPDDSEGKRFDAGDKRALDELYPEMEKSNEERADPEPKRTAPKADAQNDDENSIPASDSEPVTADAIDTEPLTEAGIEVDDSQLDSFTELCNTHGISKDAAQEILNLHASQTDAAVESRILQWEEDCVTDREIGGHNLDKATRMARGVFEHYGDDSLAELLSETGLGSHPAIVKWAFRVAQGLKKHGRSIS